MLHTMAAHATVALAQLPTAAVPNPIDGMVPDFNVFGAQFNTTWKKIFAGVWAVLLILSIGYLARGILGIAQSHESHPNAMRGAKREAMHGAIAVMGLAALGVIVTALLSLVS